MSSGPYTEGYPVRVWHHRLGTESENIEVVPLSDAERMREALEKIAHQPGATVDRGIARAALNPEQSK